MCVCVCVCVCVCAPVHVLISRRTVLCVCVCGIKRILPRDECRPSGVWHDPRDEGELSVCLFVSVSL